MLIPLGHDESLRKLPWLTIGIMSVCLLLQIRSCQVAVDPETEAQLREEQRALLADALPEALLGRVARHLSPLDLLAIPGMAETENAEELFGTGEHAERAMTPGAARPADDEEPLSPDQQAALLERMRRLTPDDVRRTLDVLRQGHGIAPDDPRRVRYLEIEAELSRMHRRDPVRLFGYRPADGPSLRLLSNAFAHAGWLHLLGNLIFLWLVGCNLEDRWGRPFFAAFFAASAVAAALSFRLVHPGSTTLLVGASGAVAAAMGAFLVNFHDAEIRFAYLWLVIPPRWGTFEARAMFAMPFWFLEDLLSAWLLEAPGATDVAYSAHVGGFLFGVAVAVAVKVSGLEKKHLLPAASKGVEWSEDPDVLKALELSGRGRHPEAIELLRAVLARDPRHMTAALEAVRSAVAAGDRRACQEFLDRAVQTLWRDQRKLDLLDLFTAVEARFPDLPWSEASLAQVARSQLFADHLEPAERTLRRLVKEFPAGLQAARVRSELADLLERVGQYAEARELARSLLADFRDHALGPAARERLARLEGRPDAPGPDRLARKARTAESIELPPE